MTNEEIQRLEALSAVLLQKRLLVSRLGDLIELITETKAQEDHEHKQVVVIVLGVAGHQIAVPASIRASLLQFLKALRAQAEAWLGDLSLDAALSTAEASYKLLEQPYPWASFEQVLDEVERATGTAMPQALPSHTPQQLPPAERLDATVDALERRYDSYALEAYDAEAYVVPDASTEKDPDAL